MLKEKEVSAGNSVSVFLPSLAFGISRKPALGNTVPLLEQLPDRPDKGAA